MSQFPMPQWGYTYLITVLCCSTMERRLICLYIDPWSIPIEPTAVHSIPRDARHCSLYAYYLSGWDYAVPGMCVSLNSIYGDATCLCLVRWRGTTL